MIVSKVYVVGLAFAQAAHGANYVLLQRKCHPPNQAGFWNGPGGLVEAGETPEVALAREFDEEVGVNPGGWERFLTLTKRFDPDDGPPQFKIEFFRAVVDLSVLALCEEKSAGRIEPSRFWEVEFALRKKYTVVPDLAWILPLALQAKNYNPISVVASTIRGAYRG